MGTAAITVALADASAAMRAGLRAALPEPRYSVVAEAPTRAALSLAGVDVLLVDERDPGALAPPPPGTALALLVSEPTLGGLRTALAAGALGYVPRDIDAGRLALAVCDLAAGVTSLPSAIATAVIAEATGRSRQRGGGLTPRQSQVVALARRGLPTAEIAALLGVSRVTVRRHLSDAHARLQRAGA